VEEFDSSLFFGKQVIYFDENKQPHAAFVAYMHADLSPYIERPVCNLTILEHDGRVARRKDIGPAYHDGEIWHLIEKWAFVGEIPEDEYIHNPIVVGKLRTGWRPLIVSNNS
jgi:hypothetical protein